jgi:hypothetical protein
MGIVDDAIEDGIGDGRLTDMSCHWATGSWAVISVDLRR